MIEEITARTPPLFLFDHNIRTSLYARFTLPFSTEDEIEKDEINSIIDANEGRSYLARSPFPIIGSVQVSQVVDTDTSASIEQVIGTDTQNPTGAATVAKFQKSTTDIIRIVIETTTAEPTAHFQYLAIRNLLKSSKRLSDLDGQALGRVSFIWKRHFILDGTVTSISETDNSNDSKLRMDVVITRSPLPPAPAKKAAVKVVANAAAGV